MVLDACGNDAASSPRCDRVPPLDVKEELLLLFPLKARVVAKTKAPEPARTFVHVFDDDDDDDDDDDAKR